MLIEDIGDNLRKLIIIFILLWNINVLASNTSTIVMDVDTSRILYQNNAYEKKLIASTTKIMTFVVAYEYAKDFQDVYVEAGNEILSMYGTSIYLSLHEKMLLRDLLYGLMLRSGNDAACVIANFVGGSEEGFVKLMNKKAKALGMNNTVFNNPHGLDEKTKNYSTAYDMALLSIYANKIPFYQKVTSTKYYKVTTDTKAYSWTNRNKLLFSYANFVSGKTGYTPSAGKTLVSSAKQDNLHLTIVSLNDANHYENHRLLYDEMFKNYHNYLIVSKEDFSLKYNNMYIKKDIYYPLKDSEINEIDKKLVLNSRQGNMVGELIVTLKNKEIIKENVYLKEEDKQEKEDLSIIKRIKNFFQNLF